MTRKLAVRFIPSSALEPFIGPYTTWAHVHNKALRQAPEQNMARFGGAGNKRVSRWESPPVVQPRNYNGSLVISLRSGKSLAKPKGRVSRLAHDVSRWPMVCKGAKATQAKAVLVFKL